jgi:HD-GYP domain-containing protein (c-di-GMP phosphodiesterase class II)
MAMMIRMRCKRVELNKLKVGAVLTTAVVDPAQPRLKLLAAGTEITEHFLHQLKRRGIGTVILSERDIALLAAFSPQGRRTNVPPPPKYVRSHLENDGSRTADRLIRLADITNPDDADFASHDPNSDLAIKNQIQRQHGTRYAKGLQEQWARESDQRIDLVTDFIEDSLVGHGSSISPLYDTSVELIDRWMEDPDALVALATSPYQSNYPSRHGVHLASLAIAIGAEMGLDRQSLIDLSVGCLIHDVGMRAVGVGLFETKEPLTDGQLRRLADHPVKAIEIAAKYGDALSIGAQMVLYQIHERCDGSGYPRGYRSHQIHPLAKVASVADAFVGMVSQRKHRLAIQGYHANVALLEEAKKGRFDASVIRALLKATSLHPIGSKVQLNTDHVGRVIRSGGDDFVRPTIAMWHPDRDESESAIVDLAVDECIKIVKSLPAAA